jgi:hypothetical protein
VAALCALAAAGAAAWLPRAAQSEKEVQYAH